MFEIFRSYIAKKVTLTEDELEIVREASVPKKLRKRQYLLREGEVSQLNTFVTKGCLRSYRIGNDGTEHILRFAVENWWMSDRISFTTGNPSLSFIDALEDSELLTWTKDKWEELKVKVPAVHIFEEQLLARSFNASQDRIHDVIATTPEERYQKFMTSYPDVFNRVPLHMIASYLGVSRETLTRIRKQSS